MEIYLQEAAAVTYFPNLPAVSKNLVLTAARAFPQVSERAISFMRTAIPYEAWWLLFSDSGQTGRVGKMQGKEAEFWLEKPSQQLDNRQTEEKQKVQQRLSS